MERDRHSFHPTRNIERNNRSRIEFDRLQKILIMMLTCKQFSRSFMTVSKKYALAASLDSSIRMNAGRKQKLSTLPTDHRPDLWLDEVKELNMEQLLSENLRTDAWKGDKVLAAMLAEVLWDDDFRRVNMADSFLTANSATQLFGKTLSNRALQERAPYILAPVKGASNHIRRCSTHAAGTLVEAAAAHIYDRNRNAVGDLIAYLIKIAINPSISKQEKIASLLDVVSYSEGIRVEIYRAGGPDHKPEFEAIAFWNEFSARGFGHRKKEAENAAFDKLNGMF